jgi:hypothetical protein
MIVSMQHDTSVREIEKHYGAFITDHSDSLARQAMLDTADPVDGNVVRLHTRA